METYNLLQEFPPVSTETWEETIARDLKGANYTRKLIWHTAEGLAVKPYYRAEDLAKLEFLGATNCSSPHVFNARLAGDWLIREEIDATDPEQANRCALHAVVAGAEEIAFLNVAVKDASDLRQLLANMQEIPTHFQNAGEPLIRLLIDRLRDRKHPALVSTGWDPLTDPDFAAQAVKVISPGFVPFTIDGSHLEESGATAVEEIGFTLAAGVDFLADMLSHDVDIKRSATSIEFAFAIGASYFLQIAKLRAFRMLWAEVVESFGCPADNAPARIHARTSHWNKTIYDPHINIVRATTEAMSAVLGGADSISVAAFDDCYKTPDEASRRLARNTQLILKKEALLSHVKDPAAGSYCLEVFTDFIARNAWQAMQAIESEGGYRKALAEGQVAKALHSSLAKREEAVASRHRVFTGTNKFADPSEKALDRIEPMSLACECRGAHRYESLRLRSERHAANTGMVPRVLLAEFGDVKMRSARSTFAVSFFACAGFNIVTQLFSNADEIAAFDADLIILCSSDSEYLCMTKELVPKQNSLGRTPPLIVAGRPECADQLRAAGISDFIHIKSDPIEVLTTWQHKLGIEA